MNQIAVVLAAGAGTRFKSQPTHKLLADLRGRPVLAWVLQAAVESAIGPVYVVSGATDIGPVLRNFPDVVEVANPDWATGQASSLQTAVQIAAKWEVINGAKVDSIVIGLGDQPFVTASAWRNVATTPSPLAVATYNATRGNPVKIDRAIWDDLPKTGDEGARIVMRIHPQLVREVPCEGSSFDIDSPEDLQPWK